MRNTPSPSNSLSKAFPWWYKSVGIDEKNRLFWDHFDQLLGPVFNECDLDDFPFIAEQLVGEQWESEE